MQADVICATLGGAGHPTLATLPFDFETVVIDEAAQAVELDTLIPLRYGCQRCIMVGDPKQLPPTVISREAERMKYSQSLFVRLFNNIYQFVFVIIVIIFFVLAIFNCLRDCLFIFRRLWQT